MGAGPSKKRKAKIVEPTPKAQPSPCKAHDLPVNVVDDNQDEPSEFGDILEGKS